VSSTALQAQVEADIPSHHIVKDVDTSMAVAVDDSGSDILQFSFCVFVAEQMVPLCLTGTYDPELGRAVGAIHASSSPQFNFPCAACFLLL
jgi:hypothetical protein